MASTPTRAQDRAPRPLSPHLEIYRFTLTMAMSIAHRITGIGLYVGVLLLAWFLVAAATDASAFQVFSSFIHSIIGRLCCSASPGRCSTTCSAASGTFLWDAGYGLDDPQREQSRRRR
jgi:succinate dehydrogenase / fumarate reductase cytochrome b subunit